MSPGPAEKKGWNKYYRALWEHANAKPAATEEHPWGDTVFKIRNKGFAFMGPYGSSGGVTVKPPKDELDGLLELPYITKAAYIGRFGWVAVKVEDAEALRLALELIDDTYDQFAPKAKRAPAKR